ncbi:MAG TPA: RNA polymerase sigma factor [Ktedonobacterales bacterium]|nr:RNA polymerase sigma factor [Ktedonobacterales bacterium]
MPQLAGDASPGSFPGEPALVELVERARAGEDAAFAALFEHYNVRIFRYLERIVGSPEVGRDLTQDTFVAAWRGLPSLQDVGRFSPWLYRIATNLARLHLRRARLIHWLPWGASEQPIAGVHLSLVDPEEQIGQSEWVRLALAEVTPKYRICLLLQLEGGFSQREIAHLLDVTEKSISSYISRGRQQFRLAYHRLEGESYSPTKGARIP